MITVWDFGGVKFYWDLPGSGWTSAAVDFYGSDANHSVADGVFKYVPQYLQDTNVDHDIVSKFLGYRAELTIELLNIKANDGSAIANFFAALNVYYDTYELGAKVNVDTTGDGGVWVENLMLTSDISMININRLEIGQRLTLKFVAKELTQSIPTITSNSTQYDLIFNTDDALFNTDNAVIFMN